EVRQRRLLVPVGLPPTVPGGCRRAVNDCKRSLEDLLVRQFIPEPVVPGATRGVFPEEGVTIRLRRALKIVQRRLVQRLSSGESYAGGRRGRKSPPDVSAHISRCEPMAQSDSSSAMARIR